MDFLTPKMGANHTIPIFKQIEYLLWLKCQHNLF